MKSPRISIANARDQSGFTLLELLIVMGIAVLLGGLGLFLSMDTYRSGNFTAGVDTIVVSLQRSRSRALNNIDESKHGVKILSGQYVIFEGATYNPLDPKNEVINGRSNFTITGPDEVVFDQLSGKSSVDGDILINDGSKIASISLNYEGQIDY